MFGKLFSFNLYDLLLCFSLLPKHSRSSHRYKSLYEETFLKQQLSKSHLVDFLNTLLRLYLFLFSSSAIMSLQLWRAPGKLFMQKLLSIQW